MNAKVFKQLIKEAVREAVREEIGVLLLEQKKQELNEIKVTCFILTKSKKIDNIVFINLSHKHS